MRRVARLAIVAGFTLALAACAEGETIHSGGNGGSGTGAGHNDGGDGPEGGKGGSTSSSFGGEGGDPSTGGSPSTGGTGGEGGGVVDTCPNGVKNPGEDCDGIDLGGASCTSIGMGFTGGTLSCDANCQFNTSACTTTTNNCGNNTINPGEACDGTNLNGQNCVTQGFDTGTLACNASCSGFITSGCMNTCTPVNLLTVNPGFDSGPNGGGWTESSLNFGSPVCDVATCGTGNGVGPHSGTYWAWFGGTNTAFEDAVVQRAVTIPTGTATLNFQLDLPSCESTAIAADTLTVTIDGTAVYSTTNGNSGCGVPGWELITINVSQFANGQSHTLKFEGITDDFNAATNFMLDSVELIGCQ
ncbi:MAG: hypothetical protein U0271_13100 [Polyangiaceae bacterium]